MNTNNDNAALRNENDAASSDKTQAPTSAASQNVTTTRSSVGVPECDLFITKYEACVSENVPEAARPRYNQNLALLQSSWLTLAGNPQTKATLAEVCQRSIEDARLSMKSFGCHF